jgi:hypothetical protein
VKLYSCGSDISLVLVNLFVLASLIVNPDELSNMNVVQMLLAGVVDDTELKVSGTEYQNVRMSIMSREASIKVWHQYVSL